MSGVFLCGLSILMLLLPINVAAYFEFYGWPMSASNVIPFWNTISRKEKEKSAQNSPNDNSVDLLIQDGVQNFYIFSFSAYFVLRKMVEKWNFRHGVKTTGENIQDLYELAIHLAMFLSIGNVIHRFTMFTPLYFIGAIGTFLAMYTTAYEICPNITLDNTDDSDGSVFSVFVIIVSLVTLLVILTDNIMSLMKGPNRSYVQISVLFVTCLHVGAFAMKTKFHLHHHYWAFVVGLVIQKPTHLSMLAQALSISVFLHGITVWGYEKVFW